MGARAPFLTRFLLALLTLTIAPGFIPGTSAILQSTAHAQGQPMIELISGGDVVGDGVTPVTLHIVAFNPNGTSMQSGSLKLNVQSGTAGKVSLVRPGLFQVNWTPPKVDARTDVIVGLRGKTETKIGVTKDWSITAQPPLGQRVDDGGARSLRQRCLQVVPLPPRLGFDGVEQVGTVERRFGNVRVAHTELFRDVPRHSRSCSRGECH